MLDYLSEIELCGLRFAVDKEYHRYMKPNRIVLTLAERAPGHVEGYYGFYVFPQSGLVYDVSWSGGIECPWKIGQVTPNTNNSDVRWEDVREILVTSIREDPDYMGNANRVHKWHVEREEKTESDRQWAAVRG
jgi:hypothetical protein